MTTHDIVLVLYCLDIGHVLFPNKKQAAASVAKYCYN